MDNLNNVNIEKQLIDDEFTNQVIIGLNEINNDLAENYYCNGYKTRIFKKGNSNKEFGIHFITYNQSNNFQIVVYGNALDLASFLGLFKTYSLTHFISWFGTKGTNNGIYALDLIKKYMKPYVYEKVFYSKDKEYKKKIYFNKLSNIDFALNSKTIYVDNPKKEDEINISAKTILETLKHNFDRQSIDENYEEIERKLFKKKKDNELER